MTDPAVVAALGIEAVQWLDEAGNRVTVRVSGRWRRRPTATGQPWLVIDAHGERHRFPAMPEPPGLGGTLPGTWRMSFRVPADLTRAPNMRAWLQLGSVLVPLPAEPAVQPIPPALEPRSVGVLELEEAVREEQLREAERALESERARTSAAEAAAAELASRVAALAQELEQRQGEIAHLTATIDVHEQRLRSERQHAHAEEMVRRELVHERDRLRDMLEDARLLAQGLEDDLAAARRRADEAEHLAAAARRINPPAAVPAPSPASVAPPPEALIPPPIPRVPPPAPVIPPPELRRHAPRRLRAYAAERSLARLARGVITSPPVTRLPARPVWSSREREFITARAATARRTDEAQLTAGLESLRDELGDVRAMAEREREARRAAEALSDHLHDELEEQRARSARAFAALDELRGQIDWVRRTYVSLAAQAQSAPEPPPAPSASPASFVSPAPSASPASSASPAPSVSPEPPAPPAPAPARNGGFEFHRLDAARTRLREQTPAPPEEDAVAEPDAPAEARPEPEATFTLAPLAKDDPERAGSLLIALLPAQGLVHPAPIAYDLVLPSGSCVRVTVPRWGATEVDRDESPRPLADVSFRLEGDPAQIVRLLDAGAFRRLVFRRRLARVRGDRQEVGALRALLHADLPATELRRAGVRLNRLAPGSEQPNRATSG